VKPLHVWITVSMRNKALHGTWLISDSYKDKETGFMLTETTRFYGTLSEAMDEYTHHLKSQDLRFQFYSFKDETSFEQA
jgi:hypothetical protein